MVPTPDEMPETTVGSGIAVPRHRLFISHAGADSRRAVELAERIEAAGLPVWIDKKHLVAGEPWLDQLENALTRKTSAFAIYLTASGAEDWVRTEVRQALIRKVDAEREGGRYPFIPVIADSATDLDKLPPFARHDQGVFLDDDTALQKLIAAVTGREAETIALVDEPFLGLEAFTAADSHLFFGRDEETLDLIDRLQRTNLLLIVGDSGSGKSSLVKAGLVPAFREGRFAPRLGRRPEPELFHVVEMRPQGDPFDGLITGISNAARGLSVDAQLNAKLLDSAFDRLRQQEPSALRDALREGAPADSQILLVVDQFEELWTQTPDARRGPFLDGLLDVARDDDPSRRVVATMRRDYSALTGTHQAFGERLEAAVSGERLGVYNLRRMTDAGLRACIERPLALAGTPRDEARELADEILRDAGDQPGDLALIEMALSETWKKCGGRGQLIEAYRAIGRIEGAIRKAADEVYKALSRDERKRAETIFLRLVRLGDTGGTTRRVARLDEFDTEAQTLARHLGSKEGKRLLVLGGGLGTPETAELAHEQLTTQWPTYIGWLRDDDGDRRATDKRTLDLLTAWQSRLLAAGSTWRGLPRSSDRRTFQSLLKRRRHWLSQPERQLVKRSRALAYAQRGLLALGLAIAILASAWAYNDQKSRTAELERQLIVSEATSIGFQLEFPGGEITERDREALAQLSDPDEAADRALAVKQAFVDDVLRRDSLAERVGRRPEAVFRALAGTDLVTRQKVADWLETSQPISRNAIVARGLALTELAAISPEPLLAAMATTTDASHLSALGQGLAAVAEGLSGEQAERALELLLLPMKATTNTSQLSGLGQGLAAVAEGLSGEQAEPAFMAILRELAAMTEPTQRGELDQSLAAKAKRLSREQTEEMVKQLLAATAATSNGWQIGAVGHGLAALAEGLNGKQAEQAFDALLTAMAAPTDDRLFRTVGQGLALLVAEHAKHLTEAQAAAAFGSILAVVKATRDRDQLSVFDQGLVAIADRLSGEQAEQAFVDLLTAIAETTHPDQHRVLSHGLVVVAERLSGAQAVRAAEVTLAVMAATINDSRQRALGRGLSAIAQRLTDAQAAAGVDKLLAAIAATIDPIQSQALGLGLAAMVARLTEAGAAAMFNKLLTAITTTSNGWQVSALGQSLAAAAERLSEEQVEQAVESLMAAINLTSATSQQSALGQGLAAMAETLIASQAVAAVEPILMAIEAIDDPDQLKALGQGLAALAEPLTDMEAAEVVVPILAAIEATNDRNKVDAIVKGLAAMAKRLTETQAAAAVEKLLTATEESIDPWKLGILAQCLAAMPERLTDAQAVAAVAKLLTAIETTTGLLRLRALGNGLPALTEGLTEMQATAAVEPMLAAMAATIDPPKLQLLSVGLAAMVRSNLSELRALQEPINAMRIPLMAGRPTTILLTAINDRFADTPQTADGAGYWDVIEWIAASHPEIDLVTPPENPFRPGGTSAGY